MATATTELGSSVDMASMASTTSLAQQQQQQQQQGEHGGALQGNCRWYSEAGLWRRLDPTANPTSSFTSSPVKLAPLATPDNDNLLKTIDSDGNRKRLQVPRGVFSRMSNGSEDKPACKKVRKQLLCCRICQGDYVRPKVLPCLHTFCEQCLLSEVPAHSLAVTCPTCRQQSILPLDGVSALRDNVVLIRLMEAMEQLVSCAVCQTGSAVSSCLDCVDSFCKSCATTHVELEPRHTIVPLTASCAQLEEERTLEGSEEGKGSSELMSCPKHSGQQLDLYCAECETIICATCSSRAGEHEGHSASPLTSTVEEHKRLLRDLLNTVKTQLAAIQSSMDSIKNTSASLLDNYRAAEYRVRECFDTLSRTLLERKEALLNNLEATYRTKHERLAKQLRELQEAAGGMSNSCMFTESALGRASELEMLLVRKEMADTLARLSASNLPPTTQTDTDELTFESNLLNLVNIVKGFGTIAPSNEPTSCDIETSGGGLQWCYVGQESTVNISINSAPPATDGESSSELTANITSLTGGDIVTPAVTKLDPNNYKVVYTTPREGTYQIELCFRGKQVAGSPFIVLALASGETETVETDSSVGEKPNDVISSKRSVSIVENKSRGRGTKRPNVTSPRSRSCAANLDSNMMAKMGRKGKGKGEFANPQGVCYSQGKCVVADSNNQTIQVFTDMGICKLRFGTRGSLPGQLQKPTSVATLPNGNFVVADYDNKCVTIFAPDGKYISRLGATKLLGPKGLCVDQLGNIVVVDNKASCVFVFQPNGKLLLKFGSRGGGDSQFSGLHSCAATPHNDYVVTDSHNHCVRVFDVSGAFKYSFGSHGLGNGQFNAPTGVAVDNKGNILVADWGNSRIQVFDSRGTFLSLVNTTTNPLWGPQGLCLTTNGHVLVADSGNQCLKVFKYKSAAIFA